MNQFLKHPGQILVVTQWTPGEGSVLQVAPYGKPDAENLLTASVMARDWSAQLGCVSAEIWSPDERLVSRFVDGELDPTAGLPNEYAGML